MTGDAVDVDGASDDAEITGGAAKGGDRLARAAAKLRPRGGVPVDRWLQLAGTVLPLVGIVAIVAAWYGVSHTAREWRQTPYLVSGGLLGLGLIFLGGFTYFAYWLTNLVEQSHRQTQVLERLEAALTSRSADGPASDDALVVSGGVAHRPECALLAGSSDVAAWTPGTDVVGCAVCRPELPAPAKQGRTPPGSRRRRTA